MPVHRPFTTKTLEDTQAAELLCFPNDHLPHDWGVMIGSTEMGRRQLAMLASSDANHPAFSIAQQDDGNECVSFGLGWVFEPLPLLGPMSRDLREVPGSWIVQGETVAMRFSRRPMQGGQLVLSMETMEPANVGRFFAVGGRYWRLWASEVDRTDPLAKPLVQVLPEAAGE